MRLSIIGAGQIGQALADKWQAVGHDVAIGVRSPSADVVRARTVDVDEALKRDVVVLAIPGGAVDDFLAAHSQQLTNTLLIDATNSVGGSVMHHAAAAAGVEGLRYARAFNSLGVENIVTPSIGGVSLDMFYSCPEADQEIVASLIADVGFTPVWVGEGQQAADVIDGVTRLWFALAMGRGMGRHLGFRVLT